MKRSPTPWLSHSPMPQPAPFELPPDEDDDDYEPDVCVHGRGFDQICVECCPEDDDGSFTGDEWS